MPSAAAVFYFCPKPFAAITKNKHNDTTTAASPLCQSLLRSPMKNEGLLDILCLWLRFLLKILSLLHS